METPSSILAARLRTALAEFGPVVAHVQAANDARFGDYQTNVAMVLAKQQRANPRQVAQQIIDKLDVADLSETPEIAGAGFINFRLKTAWLGVRAAQLLGDARLGVPLPAKARQIVIDFSSPNVAKPMHVGHIRSTFLGDALARIAEFVGHRVVRDNHIGDWGKQFGMLLVGWKTILDEQALERDPLWELERLYKAINAKIESEGVFGETMFPGKTVGDDAGTEIVGLTPTEKAVSQELVKLQSGDPENVAIWRKMVDISQVQFDAVYQRLGVRFDVALGESHYNDQLKPIVDDLKKRGIAHESDGAICVGYVGSDGPEHWEKSPFMIKGPDGWRENPAIVQKSDGAANYTTTDLATLEYRLKTWSPDEIIYVTDGRQQLHFRQLFAVFQRWQPELAAKVRLAHVWFGTILDAAGKPFKTRSGENIKLADLLDEAVERALALVTEKNPDLPEADRREIARVVGLGAIKYADLLPNRQSDYIFSWDKMLSFQGNTAPYLQYSYVRIRSIFRKSGEAAPEQAQELTLNEPAEIALAKKLLQFGEVLPQVLEDYRPNLLTNYLYELASTFHGFFEACPVLKSEGAIRASRLALCEASSRVLRQGLGLLGIEAPVRM